MNVSGEASKHGIALEDVDQFIDDLKKYDKIEIVGLMTMAPLTDDEAYIRSLFKQLRLKKEEIQRLNLEYAPCDELSMGMSNDYLIAVEEGATFVRIGTETCRRRGVSHLALKDLFSGFFVIDDEEEVEVPDKQQQVK